MHHPDRARVTFAVARDRTWILGVTVAFAGLFYFSAYVCDDAFISFRTVDNFVRGYGLRWNVEERVQSFTSPAFTLLIAGFYWFLHDRSAFPEPGRIYALVLALSFVLSLAALLRLGWGRQDRSGYWLVLAVLLSSQAFVTFTSSGLESPLLYLILVLFYGRFLAWPEAARPQAYALVFGWVALGLLTRVDAVLLFLPACVWLGVRGWRDHGPGIVGPIVLGLSPLVVWEIFSVVYFGFPLPNTYFAKLGLDVDRSVLIAMGFDYLRTSFTEDPITLLVILGVIAGGLGAPRVGMPTRLTALSALLYVAYVTWIGGDFIGARFLAPPFLLCALLVLDGLEAHVPPVSLHWAGVGIAACLVYGLAMPSSPLRAFRDPPRATDVAYYYPASGLSQWRPNRRFPFERFLFVRDDAHCQALRARTFVVAVWGDGLNGFCRGPNAHLIDLHGLSDPLMARVSLRLTGPFMPGHTPKPIPVGYIESIVDGRNRIEDAELAAYYDSLRAIVSGPLFSAARWRAIWSFNLGTERRYRHPYAALSEIPPWMRREAGRR